MLVLARLNLAQQVRARLQEQKAMSEMMSYQNGFKQRQAKIGVTIPRNQVPRLPASLWPPFE